MDYDWTAVAPDSVRETTVFVHQTATPLEVLQGDTASAFEITRYVQSGRQSSREVSLTLRWHDELYGADQPKAGQVLEVRLTGQQLWVGIIDGINDFRLQHGEKSMQIVARSRDALPVWRETRRVTPIYPVATQLSYIAQQVARSVGLDDDEILIPDIGIYTVHSNTQLADLTPWQMLSTLLLPAGLEPYVDARGRLKTISRDTQRVADVVLDDNRRLINVSGSKSRSKTTEVRVKWLDPNLTQVSQQAQVLERATITAGFFQLKQEKDVKFSTDARQRARDTYLVIRQSANSGLLPVCTETYEQLTETTGRITLQTTAWVPTLTTAALANKLAAHYKIDGVDLGLSVTIPIGRPLEFYADAVILLTMMSIGTGQYEVWGTPFDYVHARNTTAAYNSSAKPWEVSAVDIENDFVPNEDHAQSFAIRELIYDSRAASSWGLQIVDDPRIERGDIVELQDGTRVYVTEYSRDLGHGAPAVLNIDGFRV